MTAHKSIPEEQRKRTRYFLLNERRLGKQEKGRYYIYTGGEWQPDKECAILDRLLGYDPSEPPGSPYGIGNTDIMDEIEEITYERAKEYMV